MLLSFIGIACSLTLVGRPRSRNCLVEDTRVIHSLLQLIVQQVAD